MSEVIPLLNVPRQSFTMVLNESDYLISIFAVHDMMAIDISRNEEILVSGHRALPGMPLIPYRYLEDGNFLFLTAGNNSEFPFYTQFGITQNMLYLTPDEMAVGRQ